MTIHTPTVSSTVITGQVLSNNAIIITDSQRKKLYLPNIYGDTDMPSSISLTKRDKVTLESGSFKYEFNQRPIFGNTDTMLAFKNVARNINYGLMITNTTSTTFTEKFLVFTNICKTAKDDFLGFAQTIMGQEVTLTDHESLVSSVVIQNVSDAITENKGNDFTIVLKFEEV